MKPFNIMTLLTPKPPFDPARKNTAVNFGKPVFVSAIRATEKFIKGNDTTKYTL